MYAVDVSNLQRPLTADDCTNMAANGVSLALIGCQYPGAPYPPGDAHLDLAAVGAVGDPKVALYFEDTAVEDAWPHIADAVAAAQDFVPIAAVAIEDNSGFTDEATVDAQFAGIRGHGLQPVAYTSVEMLTKYGLIDAAKRWEQEGVLFWYALYNDRADLVIPGAPTAVWAHQYSAQADVEIGFAVDVSYFETLPTALAPAPQPQQEDDMGNLARLDNRRRIALFEAWAKQDVTDTTIVSESDAPPTSQYRRFVVDIPVDKATGVPTS